MARVLALDVGTTNVRASVFADTGRPEPGEAKRRHEGSDDPEELAEAVEEVVEEARREAGEIDAVGASCFWHSLLALDRRGRPLTSVLLWSDLRSTEDAERLAARLDPDAVHGRTGCVLHPSYWPAKLAWLRKADPELFGRAARFVSFSEYVYGRLVGEAPTSLSMASGTGLLDLARRDWDEELLRELGLDPGQLPSISDEPVGEAEPWYPALGDGACSNLGVGAVSLERAALTVGTSGAFRTAYAAAEARPRKGLFLYRLDGERWVEGGSLSDGGNLLHWLSRTLQLPEGDELAARDPDAHGLTFLPFLGGERSPGWNARARGAIAGLSFDTEPLDLLHAALEGMAFRFAEVAELMPEVEEVVATGGALVRNVDRMQILADILELPVVTSEVEEGSARGAAVAVLERLGETPEPAPLGRVFEPRSDRGDAYREARERQRSLYSDLNGE